MLRSQPEPKPNSNELLQFTAPVQTVQIHVHANNFSLQPRAPAAPAGNLPFGPKPPSFPASPQKPHRQKQFYDTFSSKPQGNKEGFIWRKKGEKS